MSCHDRRKFKNNECRKFIAGCAAVSAAIKGLPVGGLLFKSGFLQGASLCGVYAADACDPREESPGSQANRADYGYRFEESDIGCDAKYVDWRIASFESITIGIYTYEHTNLPKNLL